MLKLINRSSSLTVKKNAKDIDSILEIAGYIEIFIREESMNYEHHLLKITNGKITKFDNLPLGQQRAIDLARREFSINLIFFEVWEELGKAIRSLLSANYSGTNRSLRWIIESIVFWADMQLDGHTARENYYHYSSQSEKLVLMSDEMYSKDMLLEI